MLAITVEKVGKVYQSGTKALSDVSFEIPQGEVFGFLGPNGAGKTTMVRLLNGILNPTAGHASVHGLDVTKQAGEVHHLCGVLTETAAPYESLTGLENLKFFGRLHGMDEKRILSRAAGLLQAMELTEHRDKKVKAYSTGMKKRLLLARALLHEPKVLFLDEPTSGLDPEASANVTAMIGGLVKQEGVTVFLCTHQLKYAEEICTLYGFMQQGELMGFGTFEELLARQGGRTRLVLRGENLPVLAGAEYASGGGMAVPVRDDAEVSEILRNILTGGGQLYEARQERWGLEELYFSYREPKSIGLKQEGKKEEGGEVA